MYPYRVFVSYSHDDAKVVADVRAQLVEIGATPMSDVDIQGGTRFGEEIRRQISFAHLFVPILTGCWQRRSCRITRSTAIKRRLSLAMRRRC